MIDMAQLIGLCIGVPVSKLGFNANTIPLDGILNRLGIEKGD